jgi:hypothetical protein
MNDRPNAGVGTWFDKQNDNITSTIPLAGA